MGTDWDEHEVNEVAEAMSVRRRELIARPLSEIWPDLAQTALAAHHEYRKKKHDAQQQHQSYYEAITNTEDHEH